MTPTGIDHRPPLLLLIALAGIGPLALNIFIPSMPGMTRVFGVSYGTVQLTLTLYLIGVAVAQLFIGALSDKHGRRPVLLVGMVLFVLGSGICAAAGTIEVLIAGRIVQAVGGSTGLVLSRAIARDINDHVGATRMVAYITMAMVVAPMLGPAIGGYLEDAFGWWSGFVLVAMLGVVVLLAAVRWLVETHHERRPMPGFAGMLADYATLMRSPCFVGYALNATFSTGVFFSFLAGAPYIMVELLGRSPSEYGLYFMLVSGGYMLGNFTAARLSMRIGTDRMVIYGSALALLGTTLLWLFASGSQPTPLAFFGPTALIGFANGLSLPNSMVGAVSVDPKLAGTASGLAGFIQMAIGALGTLVVGHLQDETQFPMLTVMTTSAVLAVLAFLLALSAQERLRRRQLPGPG